jgi:alpha-amylase
VKTINFILGVHNHQPVGNFDFVFEDAYSKAYQPFLEVLEKHPRIRLMFHTTGPLLDWLEYNHPDYLDRIETLAEQNRLEIMTGGYYEPILAILLDRDKAGQIEMMSRYVKTRFNQNPRGLWMAERVWEPHLARPLSEADVEFITLDDYHFHSAGLNPQDLTGYFRTDEQGYAVNVFPISMRLRYLIPFAQPGESIAYLREKADDSGQSLLVMCDDGEKFGLWPGTHDWVYKQGWLDQFFTLLEQAMDEGWLTMTTCSEFSAAFSPRGRVYLPCASYFEMSEWSLPPESGARFGEIIHRLEAEQKIDELRPYLKGSFWRNFIAKYDESNHMYRKALWISNLIAKLDSVLPPENSEKRNLLDEALKCLYRAQCNCAYWHGVFGGLYLPHLRHAVYENLLHAEKLCNEIDTEAGDFTDIEGGDFDSDGNREILLRNRRVGIVMSPAQGGSIYELDYLPALFNLLNTLRRHKEGYHQKVATTAGEVRKGASIHDQLLSKEQGLDKYLIYDPHPRSSLVDHFFSAEESPESLQNGAYYELGDFTNSRYQTEIRANKTEKSVTLTRKGRVVDNDVEVQKTVRLLEKEDGLAIAYRITNLSDIKLNIQFASEFNVALLAGNSPDRYYQDGKKLTHAPLNSTGISKGITKFVLLNEADGFAVQLKFGEPTEVWRYPVETVSQSEAGFERIYQSSCVLPVYSLSIPGKHSQEFTVRLVIDKLT